METRLTITKKGIVVLEYIIDGLVIGLIEGNKSDEQINTYYINNLYVCIGYRRQGHGTSLIINFAKYIYEKEQNSEIFILLDDCTGHDSKNNIYSKLGFMIIYDNDEQQIHSHVYESDILTEKRIVKIKNLLNI